MESKTSMRTIRFFSLFVLLIAQSALACGWGDMSETLRLSFFRAERYSFCRLHPYSYSAENFNFSRSASDRDRDRNCLEWQQKIGKGVSAADIYAILYDTPSEQVQSAYTSGNLNVAFKGNTFIAALTKKANKALLDYILFAKKLEYNNMNDSRWEKWEKLNLDWEEHGRKTVAVRNYDKLLLTKDTFLRQRYAFLLLRMHFYDGHGTEVTRLYDAYFSNEKKSILQPWALHFKALSTEDKVLSNYLLSRVFDSCDEKAFAVEQSFNFKLIPETLKLAKNNKEKAVILSIGCMRNPAPALDCLKQIYEYDPNGEYFSFLVAREINKLEDWIFVPKYRNESPSVQFEHDNWYPEFEKARKKNYIKDIAYLTKLRDFLITAQQKSAGEQRDFLSAAIAQLSFIGDDISTGKKYAGMISAEANASIQLQKNLQLALIMLKQDNIQSPETKQKLFECLNAIENLVGDDTSLLKSLYTLTRIASDEYHLKKDEATAGLLFMKSNEKKGYSDEYGDYYHLGSPYYYDFIGYFERYASISDMDNLMALIRKKGKTSFEKYICSGAVSDNMNIYKEVKGTIAFRQNDMALASKIFAEIPKDFWKKNYEFSGWLNENPFAPVALLKDKERNYEYKFNKAEFTAKLAKLQQQKTPEAYMQLAHAYFNVSSVGSSWMMTQYGKDNFYSDYVYEALPPQSVKEPLRQNYYTCSLAKYYYRKVLQVSKDKEQKALASLMLFECEFYTADADNYYSSDMDYFEAKSKNMNLQSLRDFFTLYRNTKTFRQYHCPLLDEFMK